MSPKQETKDGKTKKGKSPHFKNKYPYDERMPKKEYEKLLLKLQIELLKAQLWMTAKGERVIVLFEGRDAAGQSDLIALIVECLRHDESLVCR